MFSVEVKNGKFLVSVSGFIKEEEAVQFVQEYKNKLATVNPQTTALILDGRELKASAQDMLPMLENCFKMYIADKFQKIFMLNFSSTITMAQVKKLLEKNGIMDRINLINSVDEAV